EARSHPAHARPHARRGRAAQHRRRRPGRRAGAAGETETVRDGAGRGRGGEPTEVISNPFFSEMTMANPILDQLATQVAANTDAEAPATVLLNGLAARIQAAIDTALTGGATAADLAPV